MRSCSRALGMLALPLLLLAVAAVAAARAADDDADPPPAACQAQLDSYCNSYGGGGHGCSPGSGAGRSVCPSGAHYVARKDRGSNFTKQWDMIQWRCYSEAMLSADRAHYLNGTCYCSQPAQLAWLLCNCTKGSKACGPRPAGPAPPAASPCLAPAPPPAELTYTTVFALNTTLNTCYRIPLITYTAKGTLLAISEERYDAAKCPDNYGAGQPGGHNQVMRRSTDMGKTWGPIARQVGSLENLKAVGGTDYTNPSIVNVNVDGKKRILYQYSTQNNPSAPQHGHTIQMWSDDDGLTWRDRTEDVSTQLEQGLAKEYPGATPGPIQGVQVGEKLVMCAWGSKGSQRGSAGWEPGMANFVYYSDNYGTNWTAAAPLEGETFNECQVTGLANGSVVLVSRQAQTPLGEPHSYYITTYSPDLSSRGPIRKMVGVDTPTCEGSLVTSPRDGALYFAHPSSQAMRMNLTIHKSVDGGGTWPTAKVIWPACTAGYSGL